MQTERTILKTLSKADFSDVLKMYSEPDTFKYIVPARDKSRDWYLQFLESRIDQVKNGIGYHWVVRSNEHNEFIGLMNLNPIGNTARIQVGFQLKRKFWNQGYASELTHTVLEFGFTEAKLKTIYGVFNTDNLASARIFRKFGFVHRETQRMEWEQSPIEIWALDVPSISEMQK